MKKYILLIGMSVITVISQAQIVAWQKCLGGSFVDGESYFQQNSEGVVPMEQTTDSGYFIAGPTSSNDGDISANHGLQDVWATKLDSVLSIQWQKCLGGTSDDWANAGHQTTDGGYVIAGYTESNDGDVSGNHGGGDFWVVKLDLLGNILWQKCLGGGSFEEAYFIRQTADGGYIVAGYTYSNNGDVAGIHGWFADAWVVKLDTIGNIQWQKCLGGTAYDKANSIQQTTDGGYILTGTTFSNDGDVSGNHGGRDFWVVKLDPLGSIQWQKCLGGTSVDEAGSIQQTIDGGFIVVGSTYSNNGDVTGHHGALDYWVVKLDSVGNIHWQKCFGGTDFEEGKSIRQISDGGFLMVGYTNSNDGDVTGNHGWKDVWILRLDSIGDIMWTKCLGGTSMEKASSIKQTYDGGYLVGGYTYSNNGDVSGNHGASDIWIVKLIENGNYITGNLFVDLNSNNMQDAGELDVKNKMVSEMNTGHFSFSGQSGGYIIAVPDSGNYSVATALLNYYTASPLTNNVYFSSINQTDSLNDFAYQPSGVFNDLCVTITNTSPFRVGFNAQYQIHFQNMGTTVLNNCSVIFFPDTSITYVSASLTPTAVMPDSVVWNIGTLVPYQTGNILVTVNVNTTTPVGTIINSGVRIEPLAGDVNPLCNAHYCLVNAVASCDPNVIVVNRDTLLTTELFNPPYLDYIIHFQNTGNDTAFAVRILNNLTGKLNLSTFEWIASSHPVNIQYESHSRLLTFKFDNILLPDSGTNELLSKGFIRYRIKPVSTLSAGDSIPNTAAIYFDFNLPVITNTAITEVVFALSIEEFSQNSMLIYPNPVNDMLTIEIYKHTGQNLSIELFNVFGQRVKELFNGPAKSGFLKKQFDISDLASGVYILSINKNSLLSKKLLRL